MSVPANIDDYQKNLFSSSDEMQKRHLPEEMVRRLLRIRGLYTYWLNFPQRTTRELVQYDKAGNQGIKDRQAYDDVKLVKILIGNLTKESKDWRRHVFIQRTEEVYKSAMRSKDYRTAEKANADYAKYNRLDQIDEQPIDYSEIVPHIIEPTDDPTVLGIKPQKDLRSKIRKFKKKFGADIEDADFVEIKDDGTEDSKPTENTKDIPE
ncbi:MAG: hypothetical protein LKE54_04505 [Prevotella sp.]|jgi:hypothetical protein|nr:hypothetical protein [Prevotella sp.]MCH3994304.1 hypothetical protein [Prevotella sp.]